MFEQELNKWLAKWRRPKLGYVGIVLVLVVALVSIGVPTQAKEVYKDSPPVSSIENTLSTSLAGTNVIEQGKWNTYFYASPVRCKNGDILVFTAVGPEHAGNRVVIFRSTDNGVTWAGGVQSNLVSWCNPSAIVLGSGRILLVASRTAVGPRCYIWYSDDNGYTWSVLTTVGTGLSFIITSSNSLCSVGENLRLLLTGTDIDGHSNEQAVIMYSDDLGGTWHELQRFAVEGQNISEPNIAKGVYVGSNLRELVCVMRVGDADTGVYISKSSDAGVSWGDMVYHPELVGSQPVIFSWEDRLILNNRLKAWGGTAIYHSPDGVVWYGRKIFAEGLHSYISDSGQVHLRFVSGNFLELEPGILGFFYSIEHSIHPSDSTYWYDSGVYFTVVDHSWFVE